MVEVSGFPLRGTGNGFAGTPSTQNSFVASGMVASGFVAHCVVDRSLTARRTALRAASAGGASRCTPLPPTLSPPQPQPQQLGALKTPTCVRVDGQFTHQATRQRQIARLYLLEQRSVFNQRLLARLGELCKALGEALVWHSLMSQSLRLKRIKSQSLWLKRLKSKNLRLKHIVGHRKVTYHLAL